jgi:hypothetical protein
MTATANRATSSLINPDVLKWAREWRGRTVEAAAKKVQKKPDELLNWEQGVGGPTVAQARTLAAFYERPFLELLLDAPPDVPEVDLVPDYRMRAGSRPDNSDRELQLIQQWADTARLDALGLCEELGMAPPNFPTNCEPNSPPIQRSLQNASATPCSFQSLTK